MTNDTNIINRNISLKANSKDYTGFNTKNSIRDFSIRVQHYESIYQSISDNESIPYIVIKNINQSIKTNNVKGILQSKLVFFLMNLQIKRPMIYCSRHGESEFNQKKLLGGDSNLSPNGQKYAYVLKQFADDKFKSHDKVLIWTSTLKRTKQTAEYFYNDDRYIVQESKQLDEIETGLFDKMTYEEIESKHLDEFNERKADKYNYRYPKGESYYDISQRLHNFIIKLENNNLPVLIIAHQAVLRVLFGYFLNIDKKSIPYYSVPLHNVVQFSANSYDYDSMIHDLNHELIDYKTLEN